MEALTILTTGALCVMCFWLGAKISQTVMNGKEIEAPELNPMEKYREYREKKEEEKERKRLETILSNIESYDGTGAGQKDIPE